jgi:hypothetical protein
VSRETYYYVKIEVTTENDGWSFLNRGPEENVELLDVGPAVKKYGKERVARLLKEALALVEKA